MQLLTYVERSLFAKVPVWDVAMQGHRGLLRGVAAPAVSGALIGTGSRTELFYGYLAGAALMLFGAAMERRFGVKAEWRSLEEISPPLARAS